MQSNSGIGVCIVDENEAVPFDRRVWMEACALTEAGFRVSVICPTVGKTKRWRESISGVEIYRYPAFKATGRFAHLIEYAWALVAQFLLSCRVYAKTRFHILQACNPPDTIFLIALLFKPFGVHFVFDHHDLTPELFALRFSRQGILYRFVCIAERLSFRTADLCIATNETFREIAVSRGRMDSDRVVVVQSCAAIPERKEETPPGDLKNGHTHMVLYVGQMEPQDGVELLLKSIRCIVEQWQRKDTLFVLLGDGSELARLRAQAEDWDHAHQLVFAGRVPHAEVCRYLTAADVCVAPDPPNPFNDSCSMVKLFEYMAYARPIVMFDLKEGRRSTAGAALYALPDDSEDFARQILKLLDSEPLRRNLGEAGRERVEQTLNWNVQKAKLIRAYESLCAAQQPARRMSRIL